jgi:hypothetical protein
MQPSRLSAAAVAVVLVAFVACGGKKKPAQSPSDGDGTPSEGASGDDAGADPASSASSDTPDAGGAAAPAADAPPGPVSCLANSVCSEMTLGGKDAADAKDRCKGASGVPGDSACGRDDVVATCTITSKNLVMYYYRDKDPERTRGLVKGGKGACKTAGGTFAPTAAAGKKKPKKK